MSKIVTKYYLGVQDFGEFEVDQQTWVYAERSAGFRPRYGRPDSEPCTGGFSSGPFIGRIKHHKVEAVVEGESVRLQLTPDPNTGREWIEGQPF